MVHQPIYFPRSLSTYLLQPLPSPSPHLEFLNWMDVINAIITVQLEQSLIDWCATTSINKG